MFSLTSYLPQIEPSHIIYEYRLQVHLSIKNNDIKQNKALRLKLLRNWASSFEWIFRKNVNVYRLLNQGGGGSGL